jgi:hypothetical protein
MTDPTNHTTCAERERAGKPDERERLDKSTQLERTYTADNRAMLAALRVALHLPKVPDMPSQEG